MRKGKRYYRLVGSKRWAEMRIAKLRQSPLCERCKKEGRLRAAECVHHIRPVEEGTSDEEMERLCFSISNLQSLCLDCHHEVHREMGINSRERRQEYQRAKVDRILSDLGLKKE